jgi:uncharacterized membrane protein
MDYDGSWLGLMWLAIIVCWALVAAGIWALLAYVRRNDGRRSEENTLTRRFSRGEMNYQEYQQRLRDLRHR